MTTPDFFWVPMGKNPKTKNPNAMPYGRYPRSTRRYTRRPTTRRRTTVRRKAPAKYRRRSTALVASRALRLAKWNNKLAWGKWQCNLQHFANGFRPFNAWTPICFNLTTPTESQYIYQYLPSGVGTYETQTPDQFMHPNLEQLTGQGPAGGGYEPWNQWADCNDDVLSGKYKLLTQKLEFHFQKLDGGCRVRIDFIKPKMNRVLRVYTNAAGNGENHMLPDSLGSFISLMTTENMINPVYWKTVRKPIFLTIAPGNDLSTTEIQKSVNFVHNQVINPITTAASANIPAHGKISVNNQLWCVISTDARGGITSGQPSVSVKRYVTWRDNQGHAA